ncbi:MAG: hypothetical protein Q8R18_05735 [bacterium]|nr:hypothetical protein [bacterium]
MAVCGISTDALGAAPAQEFTNILLSGIAQKLIIPGVILGVAALTIFLYRRSNKKKKKEEKMTFRPKEVKK